MRTVTWLSGMVLGLTACGASPTAREPLAHAPRAPAPTDDARATPRASPRVLAPDATFGQLVARIGELTAAGDDASTRGCLLGGGGGVGEAFELAADLAPALRDVPPAPDELDAALLAHAGPTPLLTRFGEASQSQSELLLVALTTAPPPGQDARVVTVTDRGVRVGTLAGAINTSTPLAIDELGSPSLPPAASAQDDAVWVTAESDVPLSTLRRVLRALGDANLTAGLGVFVLGGARLPRRATPNVDTRDACPTGLPDAPEEELGDVSPSSMTASLSAVRDGMQSCVATAGAAAARGGEVRIALRVGGDGIVTLACATSDGVGDPSFLGCVVRTIRETPFPRPSGGRYVDLELPLRVERDDSLVQRAFCR